MWIFRKKREHINLETLSEYLDGRLSADERQKVERHLEACSRCREELESLEHTVSVLKQVPMVSPRRIFTLEESQSTAPAPRRLRAPAWAYGAVTSVAILLFGLVLSADLSGLLAEDVSAPDMSRQTVEASLPATTTPQTAAPPEEAEAIAATSPPPPAEPQQDKEITKPFDDGTVKATPTPAPIPSPVPAVAAAPEKAREMTAPGATPPSAPAQEQVIAPDASKPMEIPTEIQIEAAPPEATPPPQIPAATIPAEVAAPTAPTPGPTPQPYEPEQVATPAPAAETGGLLEVSPPEEATDGSTATVWRVLEGVLGGVGLLLVGGVLWRVRRRPGRTAS